MLMDEMIIQMHFILLINIAFKFYSGPKVETSCYSGIPKHKRDLSSLRCAILQLLT